MTDQRADDEVLVVLEEIGEARRELGRQAMAERHEQDTEDVAHARREEAEGREPRAADGRYVSAWERWLR